MTALAEQARTVLASGRCALLTLSVDHIRGWVGIIDDGGEPLLLVGADSPPARSAEARRRGRVDIPGHGGERLVLAGALRPLPGTAEQVVQRLAGLGRAIVVTGGSTEDLRALALSVDDVLLSVPAPGRAIRGVGTAFRSDAGPRSAHRRTGPASRARGWSANGPARRVDLTSYALAEPDLVTAYAPDLIDHLNAEHAEQMRRLSTQADAVDPARRPAAGRSAPSDDIIGARVSGLDRTGLDLWRIGPDGADEVRVTFRAPLAEPRSLGRELRRLLDEVQRGTE